MQAYPQQYAPPMQGYAAPPSNNNMLIGLAVLAVVAVVWYMNSNKTPVPLTPVPTSGNATGGTNNVLVPPVKGTPAATAFSGPLVGKFNADNYLSVSVNGVEVHAEQGIEWWDSHNLNLPSVKAGDRVDFNVRNAGGPGGFIGSWTWNGKTYTVGASLFSGKQVIAGQGPWGGILDGYPAGAQWLWSPDNCETCTHTFTWTAQ